MKTPRKRQPPRVNMQPSVGAPDPQAVLPLVRRLLDRPKNNADSERQPVPAQLQGPQ